MNQNTADTLKDSAIKPVKILLVEDNLGDVLLTREALEAARFCNDIFHCQNGEEALKYLKQQPPYSEHPRPDLIMLDINMPRVSGFEVLEFIKRNPATRRIPVIILTTSTNPDDVNKAYDNYANAYVSKPLDINEFIEAIKVSGNFWMTLVTLPEEP